jgi:methylmalonyl-CoA/ethylmalonyl-CoA epimerase
MKYKYTDAPGLQLQLCEPNDSPSPQRKFLDRTGDGVFHIGFVVDDVDDATEQIHSLGMKTWMYGRRGNRTGSPTLGPPKLPA